MTVASMDALSLVIPSCERGIGKVILQAGSADLIDGVQVAPYALWPDDRGYFLEIARLRQGLVSQFPLETTQVSCAFNYPGAIKAFHYHVRQTDFWVPAQGMIQVALVDLRHGSPTFGLRNTLYVGQMRPWQILIPPGVAHGYKVIGIQPSMLIYVTDRLYDPQDEGRIPYNDPRINYDWETQHK
ncbi:MAG: dTDP-4-dehydrorhamnose 3,5-epimerase family protein [Bryobacteraceae bacterium]|nr:dTDP-4-dehydrorhamnose 3,5-epimerase family protein [Bryobacteraceae bacterium]MDW8379668.1 dTDP-4-dehydrorhamnose 3,5-epimerase family protein [Bryobacterales bacterium]